MKFKVTFDIDYCKGCELCVISCKKGLLSLDGDCINRNGVHPAKIDDMEACIGCANCAIMCPDAVITIDKIDS